MARVVYQPFCTSLHVKACVPKADTSFTPRLAACCLLLVHATTTALSVIQYVPETIRGQISSAATAAGDFVGLTGSAHPTADTTTGTTGSATGASAKELVGSTAGGLPVPTDVTATSAQSDTPTAELPAAPTTADTAVVGSTTGRLPVPATPVSTPASAVTEKKTVESVGPTIGTATDAAAVPAAVKAADSVSANDKAAVVDSGATTETATAATPGAMENVMGKISAAAAAVAAPVAAAAAAVTGAAKPGEPAADTKVRHQCLNHIMVLTVLACLAVSVGAASLVKTVA
jgi:hypothetical protein